MKVGVIGGGAIGREVITSLAARHRADLLLMTRPGKPRPAWLPAGVESVDSMEAFLARRPRIVIEAARQEAVQLLVPEILAAGISVIICSTGALVEKAQRQRLVGLADAGQCYIVVPGGAIAGLDYIRSVAGVAGTRVTYTSRKPPAAWRAELAALGHAADELAEPVVLFEGEPGEAACRYPRNLNAALTVTLAAEGAPVTVRVLVDPQARGNTHEIEVTGPAGIAYMRFANAPSPDNPKTSALTALSVMRALEDILDRRSLRLV